MAPPKRPLRERFEASVKRTKGCWLWTGTRLASGYGVLTVYPKRMLKAHRVAWELFKGPIPKGNGYHGTMVLHNCDNPRCVNPAHLRLGTAADNARDRKERGRSNQASGARHGMAKLSGDQVKAIKAALASLPRSASGRRFRVGALPTLAQRYGVTASCLRQIHQGKRWRRA